MKGLLLKDIYTLVKQMRIMLLLLVIFACVPGFTLAAFAVFYAAMLPVTALAYDERSKWNDLAAMLPYSERNIVLSKYVLGLISVGAAALIAGAAQFVVGMVRHTMPGKEDFLAIILIALISLILLCINLPLMFRMGVEKGRIAFMIFICMGISGGMALRDRLTAALGRMGNVTMPLAVGILMTAVVFALSVPLSVSAYRGRRE